MSSQKTLALVILGALLAGCSEESAFRELRKLCEKDAGVEIYKTVKADGYFTNDKQCHHCWRELVGQPYKFMEICVEQAAHWDDVPEIGCWRLSKVPRRSGRCDERIDRELVKLRTGEAISFFRNGCIAKEAIGEPEARYGTFFFEEKWVMNNRWDSKVSRQLTIIKELETGAILAKQIDYLVTPDPRGHTMRVMTRDCSFIDKGLESRWYLMRDVLHGKEQDIVGDFSALR